MAWIVLVLYDCKEGLLVQVARAGRPWFGRLSEADCGMVWKERLVGVTG